MQQRSAFRAAPEWCQEATGNGEGRGWESIAITCLPFFWPLLPGAQVVGGAGPEEGRLHAAGAMHVGHGGGWGWRRRQQRQWGQSGTVAVPARPAAQEPAGGGQEVSGVLLLLSAATTTSPRSRNLNEAPPPSAAVSAPGPRRVIVPSSAWHSGQYLVLDTDRGMLRLRPGSKQHYALFVLGLNAALNLAAQRPAEGAGRSAAGGSGGASRGNSASTGSSGGQQQVGDMGWNEAILFG